MPSPNTRKRGIPLSRTLGNNRKDSHLPKNDDILMRRQKLREALRAERRRACLTQKEVAHEMDWSPSKIFRIEAGTVSISHIDLRALLACYHITNQHRIEELLALTYTPKPKQK
jgi:predicted transcriptional regulator